MAGRGRLSNKDIDFIRKNHMKLSSDDISKALGKSIRAVENQIGRIAGESKAAQQNELDVELESSPEWQIYRRQFTDEELDFFKFEYKQLMEQFKFDVLKTEKYQIHQLIKIKILMGRNMIDKKGAREDIERIEQILAATVMELGGDMEAATEEERQAILELENNLQAARAAEQARTTEYTTLNKEFSAGLKNLKGTRDQRLDKVAQNKTDYISLLKSLTDEENRKREGREMELVRIATKKKERELGRKRKYGDGNSDKPILSEDTV